MAAEYERTGFAELLNGWADCWSVRSQPPALLIGAFSSNCFRALVSPL